MAAKRKDSSMTAAELIAQLKRDPEHVAQTAQQEQERQERAREWREAEVPLVEELRMAGVEVSSAWDLVNMTEPYPRAVPILLRHLTRDYPDRVREGIARALAVPEARSGWRTLLAEFERSEDATALGAKWGIACALSVAGDDSVIEDAIRLVKDRKHGRNRVPILDVLARSSLREARDALQKLTADSEIGKDAANLINGRKR